MQIKLKIWRQQGPKDQGKFVVYAVDANPDFGTLAQRGPNQTRSTVRNRISSRNSSTKACCRVTADWRG